MELKDQVKKFINLFKYSEIYNISVVNDEYIKITSKQNENVHCINISKIKKIEFYDSMNVNIDMVSDSFVFIKYSEYIIESFFC